jgi:hypothetical protein
MIVHRVILNAPRRLASVLQAESRQDGQRPVALPSKAAAEDAIALLLNGSLYIVILLAYRVIATHL